MNNYPIKKPCPFCGGTPETTTVTIGKGQIRYYMTCFTNTCPMYNSSGALLSFATPAEAIENWNNRMGDAQASAATGDATENKEPVTKESQCLHLAMREGKNNTLYCTSCGTTISTESPDNTPSPVESTSGSEDNEVAQFKRWLEKFNNGLFDHIRNSVGKDVDDDYDRLLMERLIASGAYPPTPVSSGI